MSFNFVTQFNNTGKITPNINNGINNYYCRPTISALVAIEVKVTNAGASPAATINLLHQGIRNLQSRIKETSPEADKLISLLKKKDTEILSTQPDGHTVVVWIWCGSQAALQNLQELYEMNQLADALLGFDRPSSSEISQSRVISIDSNEFKKNVGKLIGSHSPQRKLKSLSHLHIYPNVYI